MTLAEPHVLQVEGLCMLAEFSVLLQHLYYNFFNNTHVSNHRLVFVGLACEQDDFARSIQDLQQSRCCTVLLDHDAGPSFCDLSLLTCKRWH